MHILSDHDLTVSSDTPQTTVNLTHYCHVLILFMCNGCIRVLISVGMALDYFSVQKVAESPSGDLFSCWIFRSPPVHHRSAKPIQMKSSIAFILFTPCYGDRGKYRCHRLYNLLMYVSVAAQYTEVISAVANDAWVPETGKRHTRWPQTRKYSPPKRWVWRMRTAVFYIGVAVKYSLISSNFRHLAYQF